MMLTLDEAVTEIERLKRGDFTAEEFQNLCHGINGDDRCAFYEGCARYQEQLFGQSERSGQQARITELEAEVERLRDVIAHALTTPGMIKGREQMQAAIARVEAGENLRLRIATLTAGCEAALTILERMKGSREDLAWPVLNEVRVQLRTALGR